MVRPHSAADIDAADRPPPKAHRANRRCETEKRKPQGMGLGGLLVWGQTTVAIRSVNITHDNLVTLYKRLRKLTSTPTLKHSGRDVSCSVAHQTPFRRLPARIAKQALCHVVGAEAGPESVDRPVR